MVLLSISVDGGFPDPVRWETPRDGRDPVRDGAGRLPHRLARRSRTHRPLVAGAAVAAFGYFVMTAVLVSIGLILTKLLLDGAVGRWDAAADRWFFRARTPTLNTLTEWGSLLGDTLTVIGVAAVVVVVLVIGRHWAHIAFLVTALVLEVTSFVTTTFVIDRATNGAAPGAGASHVELPVGSRGGVDRAVRGIAIITTSLVRNRLVRAVVWIVAVVVPSPSCSRACTPGCTIRPT